MWPSDPSFVCEHGRAGLLLCPRPNLSHLYFDTSLTSPTSCVSRALTRALLPVSYYVRARDRNLAQSFLDLCAQSRRTALLKVQTKESRFEKQKLQSCAADSGIPSMPRSKSRRSTQQRTLAPKCNVWARGGPGGKSPAELPISRCRVRHSQHSRAEALTLYRRQAAVQGKRV